MTLPKFQVLVPGTVEEAVKMLAMDEGCARRVIAGGTDLLVDIKTPVYQQKLYGVVSTGQAKDGSFLSTHDKSRWESDDFVNDFDNVGDLVSIHKLDDLKQVKITDEESLSVGTLVTARELQRNSDIRNKWTALAEGADALGSPLVRARGTLGGNICNARPAADMLVPSVALGAVLKLQSVNGTREVPIESFCTAPGHTVRENNEMLCLIDYPALNEYSGSAYYKLAQRKALDISVVGVAALIELDGKDGVVKNVRVSMGAVGPTPILAKSVGDILAGKTITSELLNKAAKACANDATPIDDHRGSAEYRNEMVEALAFRVLKTAYDRAGGEL